MKRNTRRLTAIALAGVAVAASGSDRAVHARDAGVGGGGQDGGEGDDGQGQDE